MCVYCRLEIFARKNISLLNFCLFYFHRLGIPEVWLHSYHLMLKSIQRRRRVLRKKFYDENLISRSTVFVSS